jgi:hypothetical protein
MSPIKYVIKFKNGSFWKYRQTATPDINEACSFNSPNTAKMAASNNDLKDFVIDQFNVEQPRQADRQRW